MRPRAALVVGCLAVLALVAVGIGSVAGGEGSPTSSVAPNATTGDATFVNETAVTLMGTVTADDNVTAGTARIEYRERTIDGDWRRTRPRKFSSEDRSSRGWRFAWNLTGLEPGTTYEYRMRVTTGNETDTGAVRTFETDASRDERTKTPSPVPCPQYCGAGMLCTGTPTPTIPPDTPVDDPGVPAPETHTAVQPAGPDDWLSGLLPMLSWIAVVAVVAPVVLGGLLWLDLVQGGGGG